MSRVNSRKKEEKLRHSCDTIVSNVTVTATSILLNDIEVSKVWGKWKKLDDARTTCDFAVADAERADAELSGEGIAFGTAGGEMPELEEEEEGIEDDDDDDDETFMRQMMARKQARKGGRR